MLIQNWHGLAACSGTSSRNYDPWDVPPAMWSPPRDVVEICERCPVRVECLVDALKHNDDCVRGGTTRRQRDALKRPRSRESCPCCGGRLTAQLCDTALEVCASCGLTWRTSTTAVRS